MDTPQIEAAWSEEDGCYVARLVYSQLVFSGHGDTPVSAVAELWAALSAFFDF